MKHQLNLKAIGVAAAVAGVAAISVVSIGNADVAPSKVIAMHGLNGSGQDGTATLTAVGDQVRVTVHLTGEPANASEPAHVHFGRCPIIRAIPAYNVGPVVDNMATSLVQLTWKEITSGRYVVNVHESTAQLGRYVSCGDIGQPTGPMPLPTDDTGY